MRGLTLTISGAADRPALQKLAERDSARVPAGRLLVADAGGRLLAAISLETDAVIADPFEPTRDVVELLVRRSRQIRRAEGRGLRRPRRRARGTTATAET
jgi:hypothetical protein